MVSEHSYRWNVATSGQGHRLQSRHCSILEVIPQQLDCVWKVMAHAQKPDFVFQRNGRVHINRQGRQFSRLLAAEVCGSAVVMLDTTCSEVVWTLLATHSIRQFPLHFSFNWSLPLEIRSNIHWRHLNLATALITSYVTKEITTIDWHSACP